MRFITKRGDGGYHLTQAHTKPPSDETQALSRWKNFGYKATVLGQLLDEQYQLCCYSELRADEKGFGYHIEHVVNKSKNPAGTFDYNNLAASALHSDDLSSDDLSKRQKNDVFGGHARDKQKDVDLERFVSCHQPDCERYFAYLSDGRVDTNMYLSPEEQDRAKYTIGLLNLNSPYLVKLRQAWWDEIDQLFQEHQAKNWSLEDLVHIHLVPTNQKLYPFFSVSRQMFEPIAEKILQKHASEFV